MKDSNRKLLDLLFENFERETMVSSRPETDHPYYKFIVGLGKNYPDEIIPYLLDKINYYGTSFEWLMALREIVGPIDSPAIIPEMAGRVDQIFMIWQDWGRARYPKG